VLDVQNVVPLMSDIVQSRKRDAEYSFYGTDDRDANGKKARASVALGCRKLRQVNPTIMYKKKASNNLRE
jgi:hypothetical protein